MALPSLKPVLCFADVSATNGATQTGRVDTLGYDFLCLSLVQATASATNTQPTVMKLTEGDTTVISNASAIVAFTGGTATSTSVGFVIPAGNTSATTIQQFNVDLRGRKRYLFLSVSPATTQVNGAWGVLARGEVSPSATSSTVNLIVNG
jgi:hypothetical protein